MGQPIIQNQAVASRLVKMRTKIEACKALVEKLIWSLGDSSNELNLKKLSRIAKVYGSEMVIDVAGDAMYLFGGYGYTKEYPVENSSGTAMFSGSSKGPTRSMNCLRLLNWSGYSTRKRTTGIDACKMKPFTNDEVSNGKAKN